MIQSRVVCVRLLVEGLGEEGLFNALNDLDAEHDRATPAVIETFSLLSYKFLLRLERVGYPALPQGVAPLLP